MDTKTGTQTAFSCTLQMIFFLSHQENGDSPAEFAVAGVFFLLKQAGLIFMRFSSCTGGSMENKKPVIHRDVEDVVDAIISKVGKELVLGLPLGLGKANNLANALYRRAKKDSSIHLTILTALTLERPSWSSDLERRFLEPFIGRVFGDYPDLEYVVDLRKKQLPDNVELKEFFNKPGGYLNTPHAQQNYISTNYTFAPRDIVENGVNVVAQMVSKKHAGERLMLSLSCNPEVSLDVMERLKQEQYRDRVTISVAEVNQNLPYMYGDAEVEASSFDIVLDNESYYNTLFGAPKMAVTTADYMIGMYASTLIKDGGTLQIGIGSLGDALVYGLTQRNQNNEAYKGVVDAAGMLYRFGKDINTLGGLETFEEGLYGSTEMLVDGYLHLYNSGVIKRKVYNHYELQRLISQGKITSQVTPELFDTLIKEGVISTKLTSQDVDFLSRFGIFKENIRFDNNGIISDNEEIPNDMEDPHNREKIYTHCLGKELKEDILIHAGFFLGPSSFYAALREMPEEERRKIFMTSVLNVNQLYGNQYGNEELKLLQRKNARFVNAALMFTLTGGVVSDALENQQVISGVGGQYNFVSQAHALPGGRSILMARSTRAKGKEVSSNIVWTYGHITIPRHLRDIAVTEYGIANLRGKPDKDVIAALINIADSRFQDGLVEKAKSAGKLPSSYEIPDKFRNNYPQRIEDELKKFKDNGMFPPFPFGTDFTREELVIGKALRGLKEKMAERRIPLPFPSISQAKKIVSIPNEAKPYLKRMGLDQPVTGKEIMMQKMVVYALSEQGVI